ncbi:Tautomerase/MIF [Pterulicium gracile]|uniref:L-dopachrome isomerase n=1 Tax=Pterulicium gracile TaxID=1884261 RepID=A0A5C3R4L6_9AGAR|nr:Tautomerase/MIF [Pterula gracilis]
MPYVQVITNVKVEDPKALILEFSKLSSAALGKPEVYMALSYEYNEYLIFDGNFDPAFSVNLTCAGALDEMKNDDVTKTLFEFLTSKLSVKPDRGYINYYDPGYGFIGYDGTTVANWLRDFKLKQAQKQLESTKISS